MATPGRSAMTRITTLDAGAPSNASPAAHDATASPAARCPAHIENDAAARKTGAPVTAAGFAALSRFVIANGMSAQVRAAFCERPHLVDDAPGYRRMEVISPIDHPEEIWLLTFWADEASFKTWHRSHLFRDSHKGIPKGLKLVPHASEVRGFDHIAS